MRIVALLLLMIAALQAQINSGVITGVVTNPHKAAVPNAKVEVVEDNTQFSYSASNFSGEFTVPYLRAAGQPSDCGSVG